MPNERFGTEYEAQRELLSKAKLGGVVSGLLDLKKVLGASGPDRTHSTALDHFRTVSLKFKEADKIMEAAGLDPASTTGTPAEDGVRNAALLKFLRHLYMVGSRGSQQVWVFSTPTAYTRFPQEELLSVKSSFLQVKSKLTDVAEVFGTETRDKFAEATQLGLAWCEAAKLTLSNAKTDTGAMAKVKRWFASGTTSEADLAKTIESLLAGFKKMAGTLNNNMVVITDMPQYRSDAKKQYVEAFVLSIGDKAEMPRAIYIEKALMDNWDISVLHDMKKNWARVIVHEVSHIDARTKDRGYALKGIGPGTKITPENAAINADSWAFFAADCAGALVDGDITRALGGTGGKLTKLDKNWN